MTTTLLLTIIAGTIFLGILIVLSARSFDKSPIGMSFTMEELYSKAKELGFSNIPNDLQKELDKIIPSRDGNTDYRPCRVTLKTGEVNDNVYVSEINAFVKEWGFLPGIENTLSICDISKIEESPNRLPPQLATKIYEAGESGMGYVIFTVIMKDGTKFPFMTGNAVDFISLPNNYRNEDIADVLPHEGRNSNAQQGLKYFWCLYEK